MTGLARRLGLTDAVSIGLGSMIGAGVFAVWGPAAGAAGSWLLVSLTLAAVVAVCNAWSSAALAARYPAAGGTYVYGRERLGEFAGYLAGWSFVVGKLASCAAMAMVVAAYAAPGRERVAAAVAVIVVTVLNLTGVQRSARLSRLISTLVIVVLLAVSAAGVIVAGSTPGGGAHPEVFADSLNAYGVLQAAGLIFFAFAGYARIATLAEEVVEPERTIPRAVVITVATVLLLYALVALLTLIVLGPEDLARVTDPVATATGAVLSPQWVWAVRVAAVLAACGALLNLALGVSRTALAMSRDGHLPAALSRIDDRGVPRHAELAVGAIVLTLVLVVDLRGVIGFSSFGVLTYYAVANASAGTLADWRWSGPVPAVGLVGCVVLAWSLPLLSVVTGVLVLAVGVALYAARGRRRAGEGWH